MEILKFVESCDRNIDEEVKTERDINKTEVLKYHLVPLDSIKMEFNKKQAVPLSPGDVLIQQVEEQSELCDLTIRVGNWAKRFHRSVLEGSPFFAKMFKHDFLEKQTGLVNISRGTSDTVEMALMFLYGQEPDFTVENAWHLFDLAEFFLIPNLKAALMKWIQKLKVTEDICESLLHISATFDLPLPNFIRYIESHLIILFQMPNILDFSKDTLRYLFCNKRFSYVPMDVKLQFLIKWTEKSYVNRIECARQLILHIDFSDVSQSVIDALKNCSIAKQLIDFTSFQCRTSEKYEVLLVVPKYRGKSLKCFDWKNKNWCRIHSGAFEKLGIYKRQDCHVNGTLGEIYTFENNKLYAVNIESDTCKTFKLINETESTVFQNATIYGEWCFAVEEVSTPEVVPGYLNYSTKHSTFYMGKLPDIEQDIEMVPVFTIRNTRTKDICINSFATLAILTDNDCFLFDLVQLLLEKIPISQMDQLHASENGFVVFNNERSIFISSIGWPSLPGKYVVKRLTFDEVFSDYFCSVRYHFCGNKWVRYYHKRGFKIEYTSNKDLLNSSSFHDFIWKKVPLPQPASKFQTEIFENKLFQVFLPKHTYRCNIDCPHCAVENKRVMRVQHLAYIDMDSSDFESSDDSDE